MANNNDPASMTWLFFVAITIGAWGLYGAFIHAGQAGMHDPVNGRYKAFLLVGAAYFLAAVLAPMAMLWANQADWSFPARGAAWSLAAGLVGAAGAFCVLLAFAHKGSPAVVMSLVFAGAPIVNATYILVTHPPPGGLSSLRWQFVVGILLAALGAGMVTYYRPAAGSPGAATSAAAGADR